MERAKQNVDEATTEEVGVGGLFHSFIHERKAKTGIRHGVHI